MKKTIAVLLASLFLCTSFFLTGTSADSDFSDVNPSDWFYQDVKFVKEANLMNGTSDTEFSPNGLTTRGMLVTVLWRLEGEPNAKKNPFDDVKANTYYYDAVSWASENKIVTGYNANCFMPNNAATREQITTIIHRYAAYKKYNLSKHSLPDNFADKNNISAYAVGSFEWAYANGIISGTSDTTLSPKDYVKRCQVAAILKRLCTGVGGTSANNSDSSLKNQNNSVATKPGGSSDMAGGTTTPPQSSESTGQNTGVPAISAKNVYARAGEEVLVPIEIKNNPGVLGMTLTVYYDDSVCTLQSAENGEAFSGILDLTLPGKLTNAARFIWDGIALAKKDIKDGEILIMKFKINDNAKSGVCPITLKLFDGDVLDNELNEIYLRTTGGNIVIE